MYIYIYIYSRTFWIKLYQCDLVIHLHTCTLCCLNACESVIVMFSAVESAVARGGRRNYQRKRQRHLLRLRAGLTQWGLLTCSNVAPPPGLDPYSRPDAHVEIDYDTFAFTLASVQTRSREVAIGTDITHCDASSMRGELFPSATHRRQRPHRG